MRNTESRETSEFEKAFRWLQEHDIVMTADGGGETLIFAGEFMEEREETTGAAEDEDRFI